MGPYPGVVSPTCVDPKNSSTCCQGQKPSVILRGGPQGNGGFPPSVRTQTWKPRSIYLYSYAAIAGWSRAPHERTTVLGRSTCCPSGTSPSGAAAFVRATASHSQNLWHCGFSLADPRASRNRIPADILRGEQLPEGRVRRSGDGQAQPGPGRRPRAVSLRACWIAWLCLSVALSH